MTWRIRSTISSWKLSRCSMVRWRSSWGVMGMGMVRDWGLGAGGWGLGAWGWGSELEFGICLIDLERHYRERGNPATFRFPVQCAQRHWVTAFAGMMTWGRAEEHPSK